MLSNEEQDELLKNIARRQPILQLTEETAALKIAKDREGVQKGGYVYVPTMKHPLEMGMEKFEAEKSMRRLRLCAMDKRIEAATVMNQPWCIEELYMLGAPCNIPNHMGYTPLHIAAARNYHKCVEVLLNMRLDIEGNAVTNKGYPPLYLAVACSSLLSVEMLAKAGGVESTDEPMKGYRSILDLPVEAPEVVPFSNRAVDDRARNLGQPSYLGQY